VDYFLRNFSIFNEVVSLPNFYNVFGYVRSVPDDFESNIITTEPYIRESYKWRPLYIYSTIYSTERIAYYTHLHLEL